MSEQGNIWNHGQNKLTEDMLQAYFEGKLSAEQQHEVEMWLSEAGMEADALEGLQTLPSNETRDITGKLNKELQQQLRKKTRRRTKAIKENYWGWVAIIVILLLCILAYFFVHNTTPTQSNAALIKGLEQKCNLDKSCYITQAENDFKNGNRYYFVNGLIEDDSYLSYSLDCLASDKGFKIVWTGDVATEYDNMLLAYNNVMFDLSRKQNGATYFDSCADNAKLQTNTAYNKGTP